MVVLIDGIKYACQSCIKGHRVAQCQHKERPLQPLQRKGRPISQCNHCRGNRLKNKSHVKCTCAISSVPNPINGCMCHIIDLCTCVSFDLQDTSTSPTPPNLAKECKVEKSSPTLAQHAITEGPPSVVDQDVWNTVMGDIDTICNSSSHLQ
ncbi:hypothetical protein INT44_000426 [Umbelopsis vinacea]|uniref:Copper-fist domain-containing protein n=1 Tax=Umbelopsis vinacea TaxID=44442 RepID=A0A8H7PL94_9FUNG|nr:hypothetical protein INT44_000426 [Umbelopsis vinacea]KAI9284739.1 copper fist DNA binding domain-containing protein [Umbelopsis sp. AD052]